MLCPLDQCLVEQQGVSKVAEHPFISERKDKMTYLKTQAGNGQVGLPLETLAVAL